MNRRFNSSRRFGTKIFGIIAVTLLTLFCADLNAAQNPKPTKPEKSVVVSDIRPFYDAQTGGGIYITLSEAVDSKTLKQNIRILPPIGRIKVAPNDEAGTSTYRIIGAFESGKSYKIELHAGEIDDGNLAFKAASFDITAQGPAPSVLFAAQSSVIELRSRQLLPVSVVNMPSVRCKTTHIPAFFAPEFSDLSAFVKTDIRRPRTSAQIFNSQSSQATTSVSLKQRIDEGNERAAQIFASSARTLQALDKSAQRFFGVFEESTEAFFADLKPDKSAILSIPLTFRKSPAVGGAFLVQLTSADSPLAPAATRLFQITDLSLTYKIGANELLLWVTSLETGKPVPNSAIMLITRDDKRLLLGSTDADGLLTAQKGDFYPFIKISTSGLEISSAPLSIDDAIIAAAATDDDSAFIPFDTNRFRPLETVQAQFGASALKAYNGHVFTERGVYKPGETVYFKATARAYRDGVIRPPCGEPVEFSITNPRGDTVFEGRAILNEYGTCSGSFKLKEFAPLGNYTLFVKRVKLPQFKEGQLIEAAKSAWDYVFGRSKSSDKDSDETESNLLEELCSVGFQVQQFEPPRHFVEISTELKKREIEAVPARPAAEEYLEAKLTGRYYTGGVLRHAKVRWSAHLTPVQNTVEGFGGLHFGGSGEESTLIESGESILDEQGSLKIALPIDRTLTNGPYGIEIDATVLDVDARPATAVTLWKPKPAVLVGITRLPEMSEGDEASLEITAVTQSGKILEKGDIWLDILRKRWFYTQKRDDDGNVFYRWTRGWTRILSTSRPIDKGKASFDLCFDDGGDYRFEVVYSGPEGEFESIMECSIGYFYTTEEDDEDSRSKLRSDNEVLVSASASTARPGQAVKINFSIPRPASHALVTLERDRIFESHIIKLTERRGTFETKVSEDCKPNVYFTVTAPCGRYALPTYRSQIDTGAPRTYYGIVKVDVRDEVAPLKAMIAPDENAGEGDIRGRPGESRRLKFRITDAQNKGLVCEAAVCVVDEAVLALTGYITPKLYSLLNFTLPLSVFSGDLRLSLLTQELYKLFENKSLTGGDMGNGAVASDLALRKDFRPVAYWNPAIYTDPSGEASVEFVLPDSTTAYRIYVTAISTGTAFCSAERRMTVTKEFFLQPNLPRFLTSGDKAVFQLSACNKTENSGSAEVEIAEVSNLTASVENRRVEMKPLENTLVKVNLAADNGPGEGKLTFKGRFGAFDDAVQYTLPIVPKTIFITRVTQGAGSGKQNLAFEPPPNIAAMSAEERKAIKAVLSLSNTQFARLIPALRYLLRYPYGCVEQTSSGIIALAALRDLVQKGMLPGITLEEVDKFLEAGIVRLFKMQLSGGLFAYWPGERNASRWGTQYAVFALTLAHEAGCDVPQDKIQKAVKVIHDVLFNQKDQAWREYGIHDLAAVNLAMHNALTTAELQILMNDYTRRSIESKAFLLWAAAILKADSRSSLIALLRELDPKISLSRTSWQNSSVRETAATLMAALEIEGASQQADKLAGMLFKAIREDGKWNSTADTGFSLFALSRYLEKKGIDTSKEIKVSVHCAQEPPIERIVGKEGVEIDLNAEALLATPTLMLESPAKSLINWSLELKYPDSSGRSENIDNGYALVKQIVNLSGNNTIKVGDIVKVTVEFEDDLHRAGKYGTFNYIVLEDPLPAGFIPINTALRTESGTLKSSGEEDEDAEDSNPEWYAPWEDGCYILRPDFFEMQNDAVRAFANQLWSGRFRFSYYARAICEGTFYMRPTRVFLMYEPTYLGMTVGQEIEIGSIDSR